MPDVPAYWSLSPEGVEPLSTEEAERLGFPPIKCELQNRTHRWDRAVYDGLRTFHQGKGFDPYSQDVALVLGYRLFQVVGEVNDLQTHGKESDGFPGDVSTHGRNEGAIAEEPCDVRQKDTVVEETRMPGDLDPVKNARPSRGWTMVFWIYSAFILVFRQLRDFLIMGG
ncbi:hypothetical protein FB451DRAFT_1396658 [Mycena latifolia]|nr:hypothetical protein FB451DRAFT_1396658 [Mycena latifolia]